MVTCYGYCAKCKKIIEYGYSTEDGTTSYPRGEYRAHQDHIVTGFHTKEAVEKWVEQYDWDRDPWKLVSK